MSLNRLFKPRSIAIIGASNKKGSVGFSLYANALKSKVKRRVYPVNIKAEKILGAQSYRNVTNIKKIIDLAVIATPAKTVASVLRDCALVKIKNVVIISAGFSEIGSRGRDMLKEIKQIATDNKIQVMGPNCLGFINPQIDLNMSFAIKQAHLGETAFVSQSGALCTAVLDWASEQSIGFSNFISIGSMMDIDFADILEYLSKDKQTKNIVLYMESIKDPQKFLRISQQFIKHKKIFVLKSGRSQAGAQAAKSHTGSLSGSDLAFNVFFKQAGVIRLNSIQDVYDTIMMAQAKQNIVNKSLMIVTNAGGPGVIAVDELVHQQGKLAHLSKSTIAKLDKKMPTTWSRSNPIDIIGDASPIRFKEAVRHVLQDKNTGAVLVILTPQAMTNPSQVAQELSRLKVPKNKLLFTSFLGGQEITLAREILRKKNIVNFVTPERAVKSFIDVFTAKTQSRFSQKLTLNKFKPNKKRVANILAKVIEEQRKQLNEAEAKAILAAYDLPIASHWIATNSQELAKLNTKVTYPVAMKILSADILHKIDCGGVVLHINNFQELKRAYQKIMRSVSKAHPQADLSGVYIEVMQKSVLELIIGINHDLILGTMLMFGRGGSEVELYQDIAWGILPLKKNDFFNLLYDTKVYQRLQGYRGLPGGDSQQIIASLYKVACLAKDFPDIKELDINPLSVNGDKIFVLDAKIILK